MKHESKKALVIKIGAIGDVVMILPAIEYLKNNQGCKNILWICGKSVQPLINAFDKDIQTFPVDEEILFNAGYFKRVFLFTKIWLKIFFIHFDYKFIAHTDIRYRLIGFFAFAKITRTFAQTSKDYYPIPGRYYGDEYLRLVSGISDYNMLKATLPKVKVPTDTKFNFISPNTIVLHPGGAKNKLRDDVLRRWSLENYKKLSELLIINGFDVVITGSNLDLYTIEYFKFSKVNNLVGQTDLLQLIYIYSQAGLVITHDSGPFHLAAISGSKVLGLFGPINPVERVPSAQKNITYMWEGKTLTCSPCYDGRDYADCKNNLCMKNISVGKVFEQAMLLLDSNKLI